VANKLIAMSKVRKVIHLHHWEKQYDLSVDTWICHVAVHSSSNLNTRFCCFFI